MATDPRLLEAFRSNGTLDVAGLYPALLKYWPNVQTLPSHPKQALFLLLECEEAFYGGAAGGGKSDALLAAALMFVDVPGYSALVLRRTFAELVKSGEGLIPRSHAWLHGTGAVWNESRHKWSFPSGASLEFGHCQSEEDKYQYQSAAFQFIGFDELTSFTESMYEYIGFTRGRRNVDLANRGVPLRIRSASNPGNVGHGWVKKRFITDRSPEVVFLPAKVDDNPGLDTEDYKQRLRKASPALAAQLLEGDWDVYEGMAFEWFRRDLHLVKPFALPDDWERFESFDHGTSNPSCLLAWVVDYDGNAIVFDEYYSPGLPSAHARVWKAKRLRWWPHTRAGTPRQPFRCWADPEMWAVKGETKLGTPASDVTDYQELGVDGLIRANNRRSAGRTRVAEMLLPDPNRLFPRWHPRFGESGSPRLFFWGDECPNLVDQVASAPLLDPLSGLVGAGEIVDPKWERGHGHAVAALRYGAMSRPDPSESPSVFVGDERAWMLERIRLRREEVEVNGGW